MNIQAIHQESDDKKNEYASNTPRIILKQDWICKQYTLKTRMHMQAIYKELVDKKNEYASNTPRIRW